MNPLQIQLFAGAAAGRRARFDRSPITFGRDPTNMLVIEDALVSRQHGEIRFEGGRWTLVNLSSNGTRVNRRNITDKPAALTSGDEVYVGKKLLFNVTVEPVETAATPVTGEAAANQPLVAGADDDLEVIQPPKRKSLYKALGLYVGGMAILFIVLMFAFGGRKERARDAIPTLTGEQLRDFMSLAPKKEPRSDARYQANLNAARQLFPIGTDIQTLSPQKLVSTYEHYREALAYSGLEDTKSFRAEDRDQDQRYLLVRDELIRRIEKAYRQAVTDLQAGDDQGAFKGFTMVKTLVKDQTNPIHANAVDKQAVARRRIEAGKKRDGTS